MVNRLKTDLVTLVIKCIQNISTYLYLIVKINYNFFYYILVLQRVIHYIKLIKVKVSLKFMK